MTPSPYPPDVLDPYNDDDGTMPENVGTLADAVVGHRIVTAEEQTWDDDNVFHWNSSGLVLTLDNGTQVRLADSDDCCAYTQLQSFLLNPAAVDHIITGVATTDGYTKWHIYADFGDVLAMDVGWSCGNPFYYAYGFHITVAEVQS